MKIYIIVFEIGLPYESQNRIVFAGTDFDEAANFAEKRETELKENKIDFQDYWMEVWENGKFVESIEP